MARPCHRRSVTSINRAYSRDPLDRIDSIGGIGTDQKPWKLSQVAAIAAIEAGTDEFFVKTGELKVKLVVRTHAGEKYLQSEREKTHPDDLLKLLAGPAVGA